MGLNRMARRKGKLNRSNLGSKSLKGQCDVDNVFAYGRKRRCRVVERGEGRWRPFVEVKLEDYRGAFEA